MNNSQALSMFMIVYLVYFQVNFQLQVFSFMKKTWEPSFQVLGHGVSKVDKKV
jgi:hypothetical protein